MAELTLCERDMCAMPVGNKMLGVSADGTRVTVREGEDVLRIRVCKLFSESILAKNPNLSFEDCPFAVISAAVEVAIAERRGELDAS